MRNRRLAALVLLTLYLPACSRWMEQSQPVPQVVAEKRPAELRLHLRDGRQVDLRDPRVEGDSLVGRERLAQARQTRAPEYSRAAYALAEIQRYEAKQADTGKTWMTVAVIVVVSIVVIAAAVSSMDLGLEGLGAAP